MARITYIGHATNLIEIGGLRIMTDPFIRNSIAHLKREASPVSRGLIENIDAVLLSHHHQDHLDFKSIKKVSPDIVIGGPETSSILAKRKIDALDLDIGEEIEIGEVTIRAVYANHPHTKNIPFKRNSGTPVGFLISAQKKIYFAGDTDLFAEMKELRSEEIDLAALPVWGWGPRIGAGHLNPKTAAVAAEMINPEKAIPIHWGTYFPRVIKKGRDTLNWPGPLFKEEVGNLNPETEVFVLNPEDSIDF